MVSLLVFLLSSVFVRAEVVSEVIGKAGEYVVTSREVQINYAVETLLFGDGKNISLGTRSALFEKEVSRVLLERVISAEADSFSLSSIPQEDLKSSMKTIKNSKVLAWAQLEVSEKELEATVERKLKAKKFIQFKTKAAMVPVTEAEALEYFQKNKQKFGKLPFANFKEKIKTFLTQEQANQRLREWFSLLQRKYQIQNLAALNRVEVK